MNFRHIRLKQNVPNFERGVVRPGPNKQQGFLLVTVVVILAILASVAMLLSTSASMDNAVLARHVETAELDYTAEAALAHAEWELAQNSSCSAFDGLPSTPFGDHSYFATVTPTFGSPVVVSANAAHASGATRTVERSSVKTYQPLTILTLQPDATAGKDTRLYQWKSAWNYGSAVNLMVANEIPGDWSNALMEFDLSTVPSTARIISAKLILNQSANAANGGDYSIHRVTSQWTEGTQTGGNGSPNWTQSDTGVAWTTPGGDFDPTSVATITVSAALGPNQWEISDLVQDWVSGTSVNHGVAIVPASAGAYAEFSSSDTTNPALRPKLEVSYACECGVGGASGSTTLQPAAEGKDTLLINGSKADSNAGTGKQLWITNSGSFHHGLIEFDLSTLPAGATVTSATLELYDSGPDLVTAGTEIGIHRVTTDWVEGTGVQTGTSPADGASWNSHDGVGFWTTPGGDYDPTAVDTSPVPDVSARWHQFDATALVAGWLRGDYPNNGILFRAVSGSLTKGHIVSSDDVTPSEHPKLTIDFSCPCGATCVVGTGGGTSPPGKELLLVVGDSGSLSAQDSSKKTLIESWGHTVNLIDDNASQAEFDAAVATNSVAYVSATVFDATLGTKLVNTSIGVVSEKATLVDEFGFSTFRTGSNQTTISITENSHYITSVFSLGVLTLHSSAQPSFQLSGTLAAGLESLADGNGSEPGLAVLEVGASLAGGGTAAGRRVKLPWGGAAFDHSLMNADGETIMKRAIEWGASTAAPVSQKLLLVVADITSPTSGETARQSLIESWGYTVTLIDDSETQANLNTAAAANDVVYVPEDIDHTQLQDKLRNSTTGLVDEEQYLFQEFGFSNARSNKFATQIDIVDNSHYITSEFPIGLLTIYNSDQSNSMLITAATGVQTLGMTNNAGPSWHPGLAVIETGGEMYGGGPAPARRVKLPFGTITDLNANGETMMRRAIEWGAGGSGSPPTASQNLLLVVGNSGGLTADEAAHKAQVETWGYIVELINDDASQVDFDVAVANNDVILITNGITASQLGTKIVGTTLGIVTSEDNLSNEFGLASSIAWESGTDILINDNTHYITTPFANGPLAVFSSGESLAYVTGTLSPDLAQLASSSSGFGVITLAAAATMHSGGSAAGRRVQLPWGGSGFTADNLTADGRTILQRSLEWAGGAGADGTPIGGGGGGGGTPGVLGFDTIFGSTQNNVRRLQIGTQVTLPVDGTVSSITAYMGGVDGKPVRYAIYSDAAGEPGALIVETANTNTTIPMDWVTITIPSTALTAGTYWLAMSFDNGLHTYHYESGGETRYVSNRATQIGFRANWGSSSFSDTRKISIYATYTP